MEKTIDSTRSGPTDTWKHFCSRLSGRVSARIDRYLARLMMLDRSRQEHAGRTFGPDSQHEAVPRQVFPPEAVRALIGNAVSLSDVWRFFLDHLQRSGPLDLLCLSVVDEQQENIIIRYLYTGNAKEGTWEADFPPLAVPVSHIGNHLAQTFARKDTTFSPGLEDLGDKLVAYIVRDGGKSDDPPAVFNLFSVPWIASGRVIGLLTLGFAKTNDFACAGLPDVYRLREPIAQLVWSLLLQERLRTFTTGPAHGKPSEETRAIPAEDVGEDVGEDAGRSLPHEPLPSPVLQVVKSGRETMYPANAEEVTLETVASLAGALEAKDRYTRGHSQAVANYAASLARALRMTPVEIEEIRMAAFLHDIGKIGIPEAILGKAGPLNEREWDIMKQHPVIGAQQILYPVASLRPMIPAVECHHENWDGSGHPHGYRGEKIPLGARIVSIVDAFHALTSDRAYRKALPTEEACRILQTGMGTKWDPYLMTVFFSVIEIRRTEKSRLLV